MSSKDNFTESLVYEIARAINGVEIPTDNRSKIAGALFDIVHEHHRAISILLSNKIYGSAMALERSIFESYVRGVWFMKCASEKDVQKFMKDKFKEGYFEERLKEIKNIDEIAHGGLLDIKKKAWVGLNSYVHGGFRPVTRRFKNNEIIAHYSDTEIEEIARMANSFAILSVFQISEIGNNLDLKNKAEFLGKLFNEKYS